MTVPIGEFKKIELKVARILDVQEVPGADRIWKLTIDAGSGPKEIVAGIKAVYTKEQLVGRSIVVVDNLEPATIRGVQSNGMLLAAKDVAGLALLAPDRDVPPGTLVG